MPEILRTFIAVPISPSPSLRSLLDLLGEMERPVKALSPDHLHVTLKFLGETPWKQTADIGRVISEVAGIEHSFDATLRRLGAFPHPRRPRIVWAGVEPAEPLITLAGLLNELIGELGFPREERVFHPHVTLARVKGRPPARLLEELQARSEQEYGGLHIDRLTYYQSELGPTGPKYTVLSEHPLA